MRTALAMVSSHKSRTRFVAARVSAAATASGYSTGALEKPALREERSSRVRSVPAPHEIANLWVDLLAELAPAEDAVVAHALRQQMPALLGWDVLAQDMCGFGLTVAGNVVELAFDREQRAGLDRFRAHQLATYAHPPLR